MSPYKPAQGGYLDSILPSILGTGSLGKGITAGLDAYANKGASAQPPAQGQGYAAGGTTDTRSILEQQLEAVPGYGQQNRDFGREILYKQYLPETAKPAATGEAPTGAGLSALNEGNSALGGGGSDAAGKIAGGWANMTAEERAVEMGKHPTLSAFDAKLQGLVPSSLLSLQQSLNTPGVSARDLAARKGVQALSDYDVSQGKGSYGGGYSGVGGTTSPAGAGLAASPMSIDPAQAQGQGAPTVDSSMGFGIEGGGYAGNAGDSRESGGDFGGDGYGGSYGFNRGGMAGYAKGGLSTLGSYSDGGRLLRGPGDGVSDSIPATIGKKRQPARLADGEFVVPARIVSELGNGSTEAGARKLYAMLDRIQANRKKSIGKGKVAANSRSDKQLPA